MATDLGGDFFKANYSTPDVDLIDWLRGVGTPRHDEAADEIERLRAENEALRFECHQHCPYCPSPGECATALEALTDDH